MRDTRLIMGMPVTVSLVRNDPEALSDTFAYFTAIDEQFSPFKETSEVCAMNKNKTHQASPLMQEVVALCKKTTQESNGYFNATRPDGRFDPSGVVKGWAIHNAARALRARGHADFFIDAGGDIASQGVNEAGDPWSVGIRNPFNRDEIVKVIYPQGQGVATSGSYIRGAHIYNPHTPEEALNKVVSLTVVGPDVSEADRFATAAFAMGGGGIAFIESLPGFEGYAIDANGTATLTSGFDPYTSP